MTELLTRIFLALLPPSAPKWLINFLAGFIPGFVESWRKERNRRQADVDSGAQQQRDAQEAADDAITDEARAVRKAVDALDDEHARDALSGWVRQPDEDSR